MARRPCGHTVAIWGFTPRHLFPKKPVGSWAESGGCDTTGSSVRAWMWRQRAFSRILKSKNHDCILSLFAWTLQPKEPSIQREANEFLCDIVCSVLPSFPSGTKDISAHFNIWTASPLFLLFYLSSYLLDLCLIISSFRKAIPNARQGFLWGIWVEFLCTKVMLVAPLCSECPIKYANMCKCKPNG